MKENANDFDYVMYVDASGDDGFKFDKSSSICYAAAAFLVRREDIEYNLKILNDIKSIIGCKPKDEVKYSAVRRNKNSKQAMQLLKNLKGTLSCHIVFKKEVDAEEYRDNKFLSATCHMMALKSIKDMSFSNGERILVAIDRMKKTEEDPVKMLFESEFAKEKNGDYDTSIIFRDSKDANFLLIQVADLLAGIIREHFEQYESQPDMTYFSQKCPPCIRLQGVNPRSKPLCKNGKSVASRILTSKNFGYIFHLIPKKNSSGMLEFIFMQPSTFMTKHLYLLCWKK